MYVIIVYDVNVDRVNKVKSFLRQYLFWIQNSVFEGELTKSEFKIVVDGLKNIIDENTDSIIIYKLMMEESLERDVLGIEKSPIDEIL
ncbi:CRISPR-associated endonuclease Cas2 [Methanobrevibacter sp. AbM4]|uniref:CRISPR-associated endonuclease Cas2 n=1 Tax=Methanobrevibacter sp. AbM4 TaxID=224719 RepID=UPI000334883F|nr:CRISPR-associated endonuclease Cas2 [Methanobrevibacter sp. AbM4]AGN16026.1 CRISPR-associated endoribonuclease Cas2 [Methanobrevibacter sp. AbM4]